MTKKERDKAYYEANKDRLLRYKKKYYNDNKATLLSQQKAYSDAHKQERSSYNRQYRKKNAQYLRKKVVSKRYGISIEDYDLLVLKQGGSCKICGVVGDPYKLFVDHDHKTGRVRGLLCGKCNFGIGQFNDDPQLLSRAAEYLHE